MKTTIKRAITTFIIALLLISWLPLYQTSFAEEATENPKPTIIDKSREPSIGSIYLQGRGRYSWLLREEHSNEDVEYSKDFNILTITFNHHKDDKNNIQPSEGTLNGIMLNAEGSSENLIDFENSDKELTRGEGKSTLKIRTKGLNPNTKYYLKIGEGLVYLTVTAQDDPSKIETANTPQVNIEFTTRTYPQVDSIITGSVSESYNEKEPIIIKGDFFINTPYDYVTVYFNDTEAYDTYLVRDSYLGETYLKVYLPRGKNRLEPGTYDITVSNGYYHETTHVAAFSVIKEGQQMPNETERLKSSERIGKVIESIDTSDSSLVLSSRYTNTTILQIDLDQLLGQDTLIRRIKYDAYRGDAISWLVTKSKWADISFTHVRASTFERKDNVEIVAGRVDPYTGQILKEKLKGIDIKSDFIEVSGTGYYTSSISVSIPYKESNGKNLKALRYDETTRRWEEESFLIDEIDNRVNILTNNRGIFVIVENL